MSELGSPVPRSLVDRVESAFAAAPLPIDWASLDPAERGVVERLREEFLAAGAARIRQTSCSEGWLQVGVAFGAGGRPSRFLAEAGLAGAVEGWRAEGRVRDFSFMRKPPGLRLRFSGRGDLAPVVVPWLERSRERGLLERHEFGFYDPETHQFGGPAGLGIFHSHSTCDCLQILKFEALEAAGRATVDRSVLSLLALTDLVAAVADDPWEQWDVWCEMQLTGRLVDPESDIAAELRQGLEQNRPLLEALLFRRDEVVGELSPEEQALIAAWSRSHREVAQGFREAARARALSCGPRKILPFFVIFHWNRLGMDLDEQLAFAFFLWELTHPKRPRSAT